jgi:exoribonuclease-2
VPLCRRGLPPTIVALDAAPHRMLGVDAYVQGTSPIRRAGDLLAQRQLLGLLAGAPAYDRAGVEALRKTIEGAERRAQRAMDDRERYWLCVWLAAREGPLGALVSRVEPRGVMVYLPELDREWPLRDPHGQPHIGDALHVRIARAAPRERSVTLEAVAED